jgi:hypothetical protein
LGFLNKPLINKIEIRKRVLPVYQREKLKRVISRRGGGVFFSILQKIFVTTKSFSSLKRINFKRRI